MSYRLLASTVLVVAVSGAASVVHAHKGATGVVKERMDAMESIGKDTKALGRMFQGKAPYDAGQVKVLAERIAGHSGARMNALFPDGTKASPSEAKTLIWSEWERFGRISMALETAALSLAAKASEGSDVAKAPFVEMAGTCKDCHKRYRED